MVELWNTVFLDPILNGLLWLSNMFGGSFGLAIIAITIVLNVLLLPLTLRSTRSMHAVQEKQRAVQPKMKELQKKYAKDKQKLQQETFKLYKEHGISPMGCMSPMLLMFVQMPFWLAIYQSIVSGLPTTPEHLLGLSAKLYSATSIQEGVPAESQFGFIDLAAPSFVMVILVMATMWLSQKMSSAAATDPQQQQTQKMMQIMFPLMFGFIFLNFPSGLPLYIVIANVFRMIVQRFVMGNWGGLESLFHLRPSFLSPAGQAAGGKAGGMAPSKESKAVSLPEDKISKEVQSAAEKNRMAAEKGKGTGHGGSRSKRKNR